ncbi:MAG TPA: YoaK family protein [Dongiaceae bacterium]|nr:YoaK family protein [Dongiaceae bacterium]
MINKLPRWIEVGGFILAFIAGSVNAIALLGFNHQGVSHLTGSSSLLGVELANGNFTSALHLIWIIVSFVVGAAISGAVIGNESLKLGRRYGVALIAESAVLLLAMYALNQESNWGHYLASGACGLQNAMTSTFSGAVVRTTHVTGLFTDLGVTLGLLLRGQPADRRRVFLYFTLIAGFTLGGVVGALNFNDFKFNAMLVPAALSAMAAVIYLVYWQKQRAAPTL